MLDQKRQTGKHLQKYLRNANVQWHRFDLTEVFEMDFDENDRKEFLLLPGDLLVCEGGEPGRCAVWNGQIGECYFQKALHRVRPDPTRLDVYYLAYFFWFAQRSGFNGRVTSATIAHLTGEKLKSLTISVPPLDVQRRFSQIVFAVDAARTKQQESLVKLSDLLNSLQIRAFRGNL